MGEGGEDGVKRYRFSIKVAVTLLNFLSLHVVLLLNVYDFKKCSENVFSRLFILRFHAMDKGNVDYARWCCVNEQQKRKVEGKQKVTVGKTRFVIGKKFWSFEMKIENRQKNLEMKVWMTCFCDFTSLKMLKIWKFIYKFIIYQNSATLQTE